MAFQISLGVVVVASRNDGRNLDGGVLIFPVTPLAAGGEREARFAKVFEEIADFPWHSKIMPILGRVATSIYATEVEQLAAMRCPRHFALRGVASGPSAPPEPPSF